MNKVLALKIANIALFVSVATQIVTGAALLLGNIVVRLGLFGIMFKVHKYNGFVFMALVCLHIYQNWGWVKMNILKRRNSQI